MRRILFCILSVAWGSALAQISDDEIRIGLVADLSGPYASLAGNGAVAAAEMAIEDHAERGGQPVKLLVNDTRGDGQQAQKISQRLHQSEGADLLIGAGDTRTALLMHKYGRENGIITIQTASNEPSLAEDNCSPYGMQWITDTYGLGNIIYEVFESGRRRVFFTASRPIGKQIWIVNDGEREQVVIAPPREVMRGSPFLDMNLFGDPEVFVLANGGEELLNAIRYGYEIGIIQAGKPTAVIQLHLPDIRSIGLYHANGLMSALGFYWDLNEQTRAWSERFEKRAGPKPTETQAAVYSAVSHYLKAVSEADSDDTATVVAAMRRLPVEDLYAGKGTLREDGRLSKDLYYMQVKEASQSKAAYDYLRLVKRIPAAQVYQQPARACQ